jgi:hypothetical protein
MNQVLRERLRGIQKALMGLYDGGSSMTMSSRGRERENFINLFLSSVLPPGYRFGSGDAIDTFNNRSGQLDVVVEFTFLPSLPSLGGKSEPRLYLAEGIAAVIEIKSNLSKQWGEVISTASALRPLKRVFQSPGFTPYGSPMQEIPLFAVGYTGWNNIDTVKDKANSGIVDGILIIDSGLFSTSQNYPNGMFVEGPASLWALVSCLHYATTAVVANSFSPIMYVLDQE